MPDLMPSDHLRFEVAFATTPDDPTPAWVDLSSRLHLPSGINISRGREDEFATVQVGRISTLSLENIDGALTPDRPASPYYPNVDAQKRCRLTYRDPATFGLGTLIAAEDASFEGGTTGTWSAVAGATLANDTAHADVGTKALRITWPTGGIPWAQLSVAGLTIGRTYAVRARVWSATGVPDIRLGIFGIVNGTATSTKNAFATVTVTFTATANTHLLLVSAASSTTAGQQTWVDAVVVDEGTSIPSFTTTPTSTYVIPRFDGHVDEWPVEWPDGGELYSRSTISATDLLGRIGGRQLLRSIVVETLALDTPAAHFPLSEAADSTTVASVAGTASTLTVTQVGSGGTVEFGSGTGVPTDGAGAPVFTPASSANGKVLTGTIPTVGEESAAVTLGVVLEVAVATTTTSSSVAAALSDAKGNSLRLGVDSSGVAFASYVRWSSPVAVASVFGATVVNDGQTRTIAVRMTGLGSSTRIELLVGGAVASTDTALAPGAAFNRLTIGGLVGSSLFAGTLSHAAVFDDAVTTPELLEHATSMSTGFAGERSDQRIARVCTWIGLPTARQALDVGNSTSIGHIDTTGLDPLDYMRRIEKTEAGLLFASTDGKLTFFNRARSFSTAGPDLTLPASALAESARMARNLQLVKNDVTGSRRGGASVRMFDQASIDDYGPLQEDLDLVTTSDEDVANAVAWRFNTSRVPLTRFTQLDLDAYTDSSNGPQMRALVDIGARVQITGLPLQAPSSTANQTVQGYTESISHEAWDFSVNATPYGQLIALTLDDATYGALDAYPLGY